MLDKSFILEMRNITKNFPGVSSMDKKETGYESIGEITKSNKVLR